MKEYWEKADKLFLFLFILLIPTQLGKHWWPEWSLVLGMRIDYLSPILYLVDVIWTIWILIKIITNYKLLITNWKKGISFENLIVVFFIVMNVLVATNKWAAVYKWLRIGQWTLTFFGLQSYKLNLKKYLKWIIPCWILLESFLAVAQMAKGGSLQGWFYWLGERKFTIQTLGVAQMSIWGEGVIRAYGTFSHPNSLGGFLLVAWLVWEKIYKKLNSKKTYYWMVTWLTVIGIFLTGSRVVIGLMLWQWIAMTIRRDNWKRSVGILLILVGVGLGTISLVGKNYQINDFVGGWDRDSLTKRIYLNQAAVKMWRENFVLGIGTGNFLVKLPLYQSFAKYYWMQPVHNIFLLMGTEVGMLGIVLGIWILISKFKLSIGKIKRNWMIWGVIIFSGMFDHYWLTLPQNSWLLCVVLTII